MYFRILPIMLIALSAVVFSGVFDSGDAVPLKHPDYAELGEFRPICIDCHDREDEVIPFERFAHTIYFVENHRLEAKQYPRICYLCHTQSQCANCHALETELRPSIKEQTKTYKRKPHRGDYLSRHRIDGRIDPSSCFRCHGYPKRNKTCVRCHG